MPSANDQSSFQLNHDWIAWLTHNLSIGVPRKGIARAMCEKGCSPDLAKGLVEAFVIDPVTADPARNPTLGKVRWLLDSLRTLQYLTVPYPIAERREINYEEFIECFYTRNFPVVYRSCLSPGELAELLTWERLERDFGDQEVEIQDGRASATDFEQKSDSFKSKTRLSSFIRRIFESRESNDFYMTANNASSNAALIGSLIDTAAVCPQILDPGSASGKVFLWIGPLGTVTPAHHDLTNNLFMQVKGIKEFRLASSLAMLDVGNDVHCYSASTLAALDEKRLASGLSPLSFTVTLNEGDILFIPLGWWHEVRGLSPSISLSATNIRAKNDFYLQYDFYGRLDS